MDFDRIQFDPDAVPLRSDLRVLATIRFPGKPDHSIYLDLNGPKEGVKRSDYISEIIEPQVLKRDEVSFFSKWSRFGGPHIVVLPEGQRLLLGRIVEGTTVDVALWRTFDMAQTFSNRILVAATPNGIAAFQPKPRTAVTPRTKTIYRDSKQEKEVVKILNSITEEAIKPSVPVLAPASVSPFYIEVSSEPEELEETPSVIREIQPESVVEILPEPVAPIVQATEKTRKPAKVMLVLSDALITFAIFAIMYAGYQTVWSMYVSQQNVAEAKAEVELKWTNDPASKPELHKGFAFIYIPRLQDKVWELPITRGVDPEDLVSGLGHYPDNALPGEKGNFALAGHRATYGEPLANIDQLKQNDEVIIQTSSNWYIYKLILDEIVEPDAMWVLDENPGGIINKTGVEEMITLTTCHPRWGSTSRWIWWGVLTEVRPLDQVPESISAIRQVEAQ
jgi:LPXTG-site transpeptidase (sortase) family protein